ncbi:MAG: metallophosphoesterase family protein [Flavobacteriaceae bacterium]|nr:metallophosphoesterase family protein [Flavobacteriaceae bacterium]
METPTKLNGFHSLKRNLDIVVISDVHLGTYGCKASELLQYMKSIQPKTVILNGDILDIWQFSKNYWPKSHMKVVKQIMNWIQKGVDVHYITGNHDEMLRKFEGLELGSFSIKNKLVLELDDKKAWFFHGDVFDITMQHSKWLAKLGGIGYDFLIHFNSAVNLVSQKLGKGRISLSKKIKNKVKIAVKFINNFEKTATDIAIDNEYDYVICGHIHEPEIKEFSNADGKVLYLNSGDWIENLSALEYKDGQWQIYYYNEIDFEPLIDELDLVGKSSKEIFNDMLSNFKNLEKVKN